MLALFEFAKGWNLYAAVVNALGLRWGFSGYLARDGLLRASVSTGQAIVLGYVLAVAFAFYLYMRERIPRNAMSLALGALLVGGMFASLSRGPWLGALLAYVCFVLLGSGAMKRLVLLGAGGAAGLVVASFFPVGQRLIGLLPFVGDVGSENIDYRQRLIDNSLIVIERNLWFGSPDYLETPEMQSMIQGEGIIDIVNTYLGVALDHGVVGLFLFVMVFLTTTLSVYKRMRSLPAEAVEARDLGRALLASMAGVLFIIFTVSSISVIPIVYWALAGMCAAYGSRMQLTAPIEPETRRRHAMA
jgi:O-antigen ligase